MQLKKIYIITFLIFLVFAAASHHTSASTDCSSLEKNKKLVRDFYDLAFNQHSPVEAANRFLAENYIQHNPFVADGRQGFIDAFASTAPDSSKTDFKRFIAEGNLVMVHSHGKLSAEERGVAVVDIFRVEGNLIVEHWDVGQKVPATSKNNNTMF